MYRLDKAIPQPTMLNPVSRWTMNREGGAYMNNYAFNSTYIDLQHYVQQHLAIQQPLHSATRHRHGLTDQHHSEIQ